eukprot:scaffold112029_cov72-Phaeocystis_antarctica.AAC.1
MSARATSTLLESASWGRLPANRFAPLGNLFAYCREELADLHTNNQVNAVGKASHRFEGFEKIRHIS